MPDSNYYSKKNIFECLKTSLEGDPNVISDDAQLISDWTCSCSSLPQTVSHLQLRWKHSPSLAPTFLKSSASTTVCTSQWHTHFHCCWIAQSQKEKKKKSKANRHHPLIPLYLPTPSLLSPCKPARAVTYLELMVTQGRAACIGAFMTDWYCWVWGYNIKQMVHSKGPRGNFEIPCCETKSDCCSTYWFLSGNHRSKQAHCRSSSYLRMRVCSL